MPRSYEGPLRKGERSAKVPKKSKKKNEDHLSAIERKEVKEIIAVKKEVRYCNKWYSYDDYDAPAGNLQLTRTAPVALPNINPTGTNCTTMLGFQTGEYLNPEGVSINTNVGAGTMAVLGGYGMQQGTDSTDIIGDYAYLQSAKVDLQITALPFNTSDSSVYSPGMSGLQFRVIHASAKQIQTGASPSYVNALFWDRTHDKQGLIMTGTNKEMFHDFHLNTDQFHIHADKKFRLTQPQNPGSTDSWGPPSTPDVLIAPVNLAFQGQATNPTYPVQHNLTLWMPKIKKKIRFSETDDTTSNAFEPTNANFVNMIFILCCRTCQQNQTNSLLSTTRAWSVKAAGETRYRDA